MFGRRKAEKTKEPTRASAGTALFRVVKTVFLALLFAFIVGFVIGTLLRGQLERPERYIGQLERPFAVYA